RTERQPDREGELGLRGLATVAGEALLTRAGDGSDDAVGVHPADAVIVRVDDVQAAVGADRHAAGVPDLRLRGLAAVAGDARIPRPGDRGDDPVRANAADAVVAVVHEVHRPVGSDPERPGDVELGLVGLAAVAREPGLARAGDRRDLARAVDL